MYTISFPNVKTIPTDSENQRQWVISISSHLHLTMLEKGTEFVSFIISVLAHFQPTTTMYLHMYIHSEI